VKVQTVLVREKDTCLVFYPHLSVPHFGNGEKEGPIVYRIMSK